MSSVLPIQYPNSLNAVLSPKQHLQAIVEQLISVSRTKIQELRAENKDRPLILVGFNAGAALALQVALVEQVSGVVCFGFSYNTVHGSRGAPDDHILDLTTPVLFLIGQNSARSSQEEIEFLREKMSAHTSLVTVGSADDYLRVSKTKRKIEGITQEMVDNMIMDEIAEFATMCLTNPPQPKNQVKAIANGPVVIVEQPPTQNLVANINAGSKKRKLSLSLNEDSNPVPTKVTIKQPNKIQKSNSSLPLQTALKIQPSSDILDKAVQSILPENEPTHLTNVYDITTTSVKPKQVPIHTSNPSKFNAIKTTLGGGGEKKPNLNQSVKFVQIKPSSSQQQQKFYTLKSQSQQPQHTVTGRKIVQISPANSRPTSPLKGKIINIKNTSFLSSSSESTLSGNSNFSPKKFTILKQPGGTSSTPNTSFGEAADSPDLSNTSILDIPIVFADSDGNINEDHSFSTPPSTSNLVIKPTTSISSTSSQPFMKGKNVVINSAGKLVFIKPAAGTMNFSLAKNTNQKFQKFVVTNAKSDSSRIITIPSSSTIQRTSSITTTTSASTSPLTNKKIEILNDTLIKPAGSSISSNIQSVRISMDGNPISSSTITEPRSPATIRNIGKQISTFTTANKSSFIINSNSLKPITGTKIQPTTTTTTTTLNRNITLKKVNIMPIMSQTTQIRKSDTAPFKQIVFKKSE